MISVFMKMLMSWPWMDTVSKETKLQEFSNSVQVKAE
jgi:hypothetical protein